MDKVEKALRKLSEKERKAVKEILLRIHRGTFAQLDLKKLKGHDDIFRVRKGDLRILFQNRDNAISILAIERRSDTTYRGF